MPQLHEHLSEISRLLEKLNATGEGAPTLEEKCEIARLIRAASSDGGRGLDQMFIGDRDQQRRALSQAQEQLHAMKAILDKLTAPPWHVGVFVRLVDSASFTSGLGVNAGGQRVMVQFAGSRRVMVLAEGLSPTSLGAGDEVFLDNQLNSVLCKCPTGSSRVGETAVFDRFTEDGRLVLKWRDDELIVDAAHSLLETELRAGDRLRVDRAALIAYEKLESPANRRYFIGEVPADRPEQVGGQRRSLAALLAAFQTSLLEPEVARLYGLNGRHSFFLMYGPPGCGKTLIARVICAAISRTTGKPVRFAVVKPAEFYDPYVGVTEMNIRGCFSALREAAQESGLAVLFLDEIESVGRLRGSMVGHHSDRFLAALLAELDGFSRRDGVAVIAATNRKDLCDPALLERFDVEIPVDRPDMRGAREIFEIHLPPALLYASNGQTALHTRRELIDRAVSRLYAPNAENDLCSIKFRDGKTRAVSARELMSGRSIEQICRAARQAAFQRHVAAKEAGLRVEDIDEAVAESIKRMAGALTPRNAHAHLHDLPQDVDVVSVEPIRRRVERKHRYMNIA